MSKQNNEQPRSRTALIRSAMLAMMSLLLTVAVAASLTFALFVNEVEDNHVRIQAGDLALVATLTERTGKIIDTETNQDGSPKNLATFGRLVPLNQTGLEQTLTNENADKSIFHIENAVPTMYQTAKIEIENEGSITFDISVRIDAPTAIADANNSTVASQYLMQQIQITMKLGENGEEKTFVLSAYDADDNEISIPGGVLPGASVPLYITATFLNDEATDNSLTKGDNAKAMGGIVEFDFTIVATQST